MFIGDFSLSAAWSDNGVKGAKKFLDRVVRIKDFTVDEEVYNKELESAMHSMIKKVTLDYKDMKFNTAIAAMMSYVNLLYKEEKVSLKYVKPLLQLLNPVAPHVTEEVCQLLKCGGYIFESTWPEYDEEKMVADVVEIPVQINGKVRYKVTVPSDADEKQIEDTVLKDEKLKNYTEGKSIAKIIVIKKKIINIVVK